MAFERRCELGSQESSFTSSIIMKKKEKIPLQLLVQSSYHCFNRWTSFIIYQCLHSVSELNIALIGIPGFLISVLLSVACCCALAPRRKLEIKHAKAIYEPKVRFFACFFFSYILLFDTLLHHQVFSTM